MCVAILIQQGKLHVFDQHVRADSGPAAAAAVSQTRQRGESVQGRSPSGSPIIIDAFPTAGAQGGDTPTHAAAISRDVVESIAWEVIPDIAESIVRDEVANYLANRPAT